MSRFPYTEFVKIKNLKPYHLNYLTKYRYSFFLDSAEANKKASRYSFFGMNPVRTFYSLDGFITIDGHTNIDDPVAALRRFEDSIAHLPIDPYLPFHGGLVGFVSYGWPANTNYRENQSNIPDAWFGLYDTILTFDHLENSCWISSLGLDENLNPNWDLAKKKCEELHSLINYKEIIDNSYYIKPLLPNPVSNFNEEGYVHAFQMAKENIRKSDWKRVNIAQRFHAPTMKTAWQMHKHFREKNPTPYTSFLRCGDFELSSISPSCFIETGKNQLTCNVIQKSIPRNRDDLQDHLNVTELKSSENNLDPVILGDENSISQIIQGRPELSPANLESDSSSHYLTNQISGKIEKGASASNCLAAAMPGASMTGVPKRPVNHWIKRVEPTSRNIYTGAIGYIGPEGNSQFNMAVRTMIVKDDITYIHSGRPVLETTNPEEAFVTTNTNINKLFEEIKNLRGE